MLSYSVHAYVLAYQFVVHNALAQKCDMLGDRKAKNAGDGVRTTVVAAVAFA